MVIFLLILVFIVVATGLVWYFLSHEKGEKEPIGALWTALAFGFVGGIAAGLIENWLIPSRDLSPAVPLMTIFWATLAIGAIEESLKFIPLRLFIYSKRYFNEYTDGVIYFAVVGLGFGLPENILYTLYYGEKAGFYRVLLTPLFHAATAALVGFYLIKVKLARDSWLKVWAALGLVILLHGLYDFGLSTGKIVLELISVAITIGLSVAMFVFYARANKLDRARRAAQTSPSAQADPVAFQIPTAANGVPLSYVPVNYGIPISPDYSNVPTISNPLPQVAPPDGGAKAILSLVCGGLGLVGSVLLPLSGLVLGGAGIVLATLTRHSVRRRTSTAGLIVSILAFMVAIGAWVYSVQYG